jgi:hypothetical protein
MFAVHAVFDEARPLSWPTNKHNLRAQSTQVHQVQDFGPSKMGSACQTLWVYDWMKGMYG